MSAVHPLPVRHPEVELVSRPVHGGLLIEARDRATDETLIAEALPQIAGWLKALGYRYAAGSRGIWEKNHGR